MERWRETEQFTGFVRSCIEKRHNAKVYTYDHICSLFTFLFISNEKNVSSNFQLSIQVYDSRNVNEGKGFNGFLLARVVSLKALG